MERVYRTGLDVDVAIATAARRMLAAANEAQPAGAALTAESAAAAAVAPQPAQEAVRNDLRARIKRALRRPAALVFRLVRPFVRPLAFRTRSYLTTPLREDILRALADNTREMQRASADVLREIQSARDLLREEQQATRELVRGLLAESRQASNAAIAALAEEQRGAAQACSAQTVDRLASALAPRLDRLEQYSHVGARRSVIHCAAGELMIRTEVGYIMCSDADLALVASLSEGGDMEPGTRRLIQDILRPDDTFVDVGANVGIHTLAAGQAMRGRGRIAAFEPFEGTLALLRKTVWINGFEGMTDLHGEAVSDREGARKLHLGPTSGHHSLYAFDESAPAGAQVQVATTTLDGALGPACPVTLIKIDVEGAELEVLAGAEGIVRANPEMALIAEFGSAHLRRTGHGTAEWLVAFTRHGFEYRAIDAVDGSLSTVTPAELEAAPSTNLFFARPGAAVWTRTRSAA